MSGTTKKRKSARGSGASGGGGDANDVVGVMYANSGLSGLLGLSADASMSSLLKKRKSNETAGLPPSSQGQSFTQVCLQCVCVCVVLRRRGWSAGGGDCDMGGVVADLPLNLPHPVPLSTCPLTGWSGDRSEFASCIGCNPAGGQHGLSLRVGKRAQRSRCRGGACEEW